MKNPFIYGKIVHGDTFTDREAEVSSITQSLVSGQNVICYSPRRYGKTSIMMKVKENLEKQNVLVFFIDFFRVTSLQNLYDLYASSITATIKSPLQKFIQTIQVMLPTINPKIVITSPETPSIEVSLPLPAMSKTETLHELFNSLEVYCAKKKVKGTVIFDEFQEVTSIADGATIEKEMRSAFQHHKQVTYAFLGSKQNLLKGIFKDKNRPFYNFGRHFEIDVIDTEHWKKFITKHMGKICSNSIIDKIIETTENHPYFTQMYCHYIWEQSKAQSVTEKLLQSVLDEILERDEALLSELWGRLTINERNLLKAIAFETPSNLYEKNYLLRHNLGTVSSVQKVMIKLIELDYVRKTQAGKIVFINPLFKQWIVRK